MRFIDTFDVILIAWLCFLYFKDIRLFPWWVFFILFFIQVIFQSLGEGIVKAMEKKKKK